MGNTNTRVRASGIRVGNSVEIDQKSRKVESKLYQTHHHPILKLNIYRCSHSYLSLSILLSGWYKMKRIRQKIQLQRKFTRFFYHLFPFHDDGNGPIVPWQMPNLFYSIFHYCIHHILLSLTSFSTTSFISCSIHLVPIILLYSYISSPLSLSLSCFPFIEDSTTITENTPIVCFKIHF